ncbi:MAG: YggS family pyridoxal phosphate-dependent enzyme [Proteobacteria bacterium]|nr:YggS family pyridoxal phosphate-dependent enzyme [Pseudomonadota bacterium]
MTAAPRGRPVATPAGSGVRTGSVISTRVANGFRPERARPSLRAVRTSAVLPSPVLFMPELDPVLARAQLLDRIGAAARAVGRDPGEITLTAVSKQQPWDAIAPVLAAGHRVFGENRVQEAQGRWAGRRDLPGLELRLIGPLQSNKAQDACALFDVVETVDRPKLLRTLAEVRERTGGPLPRLLVQVNTGEEPQKAGVIPRDADGFLREAREVFGLEVEGLMCIPPQEEEPALHFALLRKIAARNGLARLSMGMSDDYETAVRFGATHVRVGSALFGARAPMRPAATPS